MTTNVKLLRTKVFRMSRKIKANEVMQKSYRPKYELELLHERMWYSISTP